MADYSALIGKKVVVTVTDGEGTKEITGTLVGTNGEKFIVHSGKMAELLDASDVQDIVEQPAAPKKPTVKNLKDVEGDTVRAHLLDRHGIKLSAVEGRTDEELLAAHNGETFHNDLGHKHGKAKASDARTEAVAAAEAEQEQEAKAS